MPGSTRGDPPTRWCSQQALLRSMEGAINQFHIGFFEQLLDPFGAIITPYSELENGVINVDYTI